MTSLPPPPLQEEELQNQAELVERLTLQLQEAEEGLTASQLEASTLSKQVPAIIAPPPRSNELSCAVTHTSLMALPCSEYAWQCTLLA